MVRGNSIEQVMESVFEVFVHNVSAIYLDPMKMIITDNIIIITPQTPIDPPDLNSAAVVIITYAANAIKIHPVKYILVCLFMTNLIRLFQFSRPLLFYLLQYLHRSRLC